MIRLHHPSHRLTLTLTLTLILRPEAVRTHVASKACQTGTPPPARIAVIGAAWWSQRWHLPQLQRNPDAEIAAIMQRSEQPTAAAFLNLTLETKTQLAKR